MSISSFLVSSHLSKLARPFAPFWGHILMMHRIVVADGSPRLPENQLYEITPEILRDTILFFRERNYLFISLDEMLDRLTRGYSAERFVCFTLDDGYTDTLTTAYPILKEENIPFCVYVTTDFPDRKASMWWNMLEDSLLSHNQVDFSLDGKTHHIQCASLTEKRAAFLTICQLVSKSTNGISPAWKAVFAPLGLNREDWINRLAMSWDQIIQLGRDPLVTIGAHTRTHPPLAELTEDESQAEIRDSCEIIQEKTGFAVNHFAYPYGSPSAVSSREARLAASVGLKSAVTTNHGNIYRYHGQKRMWLPRINVSPTNTRQIFTLAADGAILQSLTRT